MVLVVGDRKQVELMPNNLGSSIPNLEASSRNGSSRATDGEDNEGGYRAKRYAVKYQPPCIFLEYEDANRKRRVRAVKLTGVQANVDVDKLTRKVIRSFPRRLESSSVKYDQVRTLVVKLLDYLAAEEAVATGGAARSNSLAPSAVGQGRNGVSHGPSRLGPNGGGGGSSHDGCSRLSDSSANDFSGSFSSPLPTMSPHNDPRGHGPPAGRMGPVGHVLGLSGHHRGSVESSMSRFSTSTACSVSRSGSGSGSEEERSEGASGTQLAPALDDLEREIGGGVSTSVVSTRGPPSERNSRESSSSFRERPAASLAGVGQSTSVAAASAAPEAAGPEGGHGIGTTAGSGAAASAAKSRFAAENDKLTIGLEVTPDLDLNKVTDLELRMAKAAMEEDFRKNQLRPGDPGYVYDKQAEFGPPTEDNDWDDDEEEDEPAASEDPEVDWDDIHAAVRKPGVVVTAVNLAASSGDDSTSPGRDRKSSHSPYNSNDWP